MAANLRVLVTGGTGFVGHYVTEALLQNGYNVRLITRNPERTRVPESGIEWVQGDVLDRASLMAATDGCDAVIHLVGIIDEVPSKGITFDSVHVGGTQNIVDAAKSAGVTRFVHMSANGAEKEGRTEYQRTKWLAERIVQDNDFKYWTIFRPSLIFGNPISGTIEFASRVRDTLIKPFPIWPVPGNGEYRLQPIAVQDVASAFVRTVSRSEPTNRVYCAGGPERLTYLEILDVIAVASGLKVRSKLRQPIWGMRPFISLLEPTGILPITSAQLELLIGGNVCESSAFRDEFGQDLIPFNQESLAYLREN